MENKFVNVRIYSKNEFVTKRLISHNLRTVKVKNSDPSINNYYIFFDNDKETKVRTLEKEKCKLLQKQVFDKVKFFENEYDVLYKQRFKRNRRKQRNNAIGHGVYTFSNSLTNLYESMTPDERSKFFNDSLSIIKNIVKELGSTNLIDISFHVDETTPHFHYTFTNYNESGESVNIKNKKNLDFGSKLQDLAEITIGNQKFKRGNKKIKKGYDYQSSYQWKQKQSMKIEEQKQELENTIQTYQDQIDFYKNSENFIFNSIFKNQESTLNQFLDSLPNNQYTLTVVPTDKNKFPKDKKDLDKANLFTQDNLKWLRMSNFNGYQVYLNTNKNLFLLDDMSNDQLKFLNHSQFKQNVATIVETSPSNYQVLLNIECEDKEEHLFLGKKLSKMFGSDPHSIDQKHKFRIPTFTNRKEKYKNEKGQYPFCNLKFTQKSINTNEVIQIWKNEYKQEIINKKNKVIFENIKQQKQQIQSIQQTNKTSGFNGLYQKYLEQSKNDESKADYLLIKYLFDTHRTYQDAKKILIETSNISRKSDPNYYVQQTLSKFFDSSSTPNQSQTNSLDL